MIVFSKKQRIENASFPLYPNITKNRPYQPSEQPLNDPDAYSYPSYHNEYEPPSQRQRQQYPQHKQHNQGRNDTLDIPGMDARLQTPSFTETKAKRISTEEFGPNPMGAEGLNWYPSENPKYTEPEEQPTYKTAAQRGITPFDMTINEPKTQRKPNNNSKTPSSYMASYLQSLQKENPAERSNSFQEETSRLEDGDNEQDDFLRRNQKSMEGKIFQQRPPSVDTGRRRPPSKSSMKANPSTSQNLKQRDPNQQQTLYNVVDEDFDLERVRREYENTEIERPQLKELNRQSNTSNVSRVDNSRGMNQRDMRPRDVSPDPDMNRDTSLTRVGSNNLVKSLREKSPTLEKQSNFAFWKSL